MAREVMIRSDPSFISPNQKRCFFSLVALGTVWATCSQLQSSPASVTTTCRRMRACGYYPVAVEREDSRKGGGKRVAVESSELG